MCLFLPLNDDGKRSSMIVEKISHVRSIVMKYNAKRILSYNIYTFGTLEKDL